MNAQTDESTSESALTGELEPSQASPWGGAAPDGGPSPHTAVAPPATAKPFTAENVPCLRNCRFYFRAITHFDHGNPEGTFPPGYEPQQRHHACSALRGVFLELSGDSPVYECSHWDPIDSRELAERTLRRESYYAEFPDNRPQEGTDDDTRDEGAGPRNDPS